MEHVFFHQVTQFDFTQIAWKVAATQTELGEGLFVTVEKIQQTEDDGAYQSLPTAFSPQLAQQKLVNLESEKLSQHRST